MRIKKGFNTRNICGETIIVAEGKENIDFSNIISMNETSTYLWDKIKDKDFTIDDLVELLTTEYDVDKDTAYRDINELVNKWAEIEILE